MGGNLLKNWGLTPKRLNTEDFLTLKEKLFNILSEFGYVDIAPFVLSKESHGDIDILFSPYDNKFDPTKFIKEKFSVKPSVNANVKSFPFNEFQVDLVCFKNKQEIEAYKNYSSWGDLGNILGRIFTKLGVRYGHSGLSYWIRSHDGGDCEHIYEKFVLTDNMEEVLGLLGLNYSKWQEGFNSNEEVFDYVCSSAYFNPEWFQFESLNHVDRLRNRKRLMYSSFIEYINNNNVKEKPQPLSKEEFLKRIFERYPKVIERIEFWKIEEKRILEQKEKLNGNVVMEVLPGVPTLTIGKIIRSIKEKYNLDKLSSEDIRRIIDQTYHYDVSSMYEFSQGDMKVKTVFNVPRFAVQDFKQKLNPDKCVWISISEPGEPDTIVSNVNLDKLHNLKLDFWDLAYPFEDKDGFYDTISQDQANQLVDFLVEHSNKSVIVNCAAGVSRSGAVAKFCNEFLGHNWNVFCKSCAHPNTTVFNKMKEYFLTRYGKEAESIRE